MSESNRQCGKEPDAESQAQPSVRENFAKVFGEEAARAIELAAEQHANGINDRNRGNDPFKWALLITIGYECFTRESFREWHNIAPSADKIKAWIKAFGSLETYKGDCDYVSLFCGAYNEYMPTEGSPS